MSLPVLSRVEETLEKIQVHRRADRPPRRAGVQEAASGQKTNAQLCKEHGVNLNTFYIWKRKYAGLQTDDLRQLRELERENAQLKKLLAERDLKIDAVRALFRKNGLPLPSPSRERGF